MRIKLNFHLTAFIIAAVMLSGIVNASHQTLDIRLFDSLQEQKQFDVIKDDYVPDEIIVKFKPGVKDDEITKLHERLASSRLYKSKNLDFEKLKIPSGRNVQEMIQLYKNNPLVEYAEPDYVVHALMTPNDPFFSYQWHLYNAQYGGINIKDAWDISTGSNVIVAVIDTGVAYENYCNGTKCYYKAPDLASTVFVPGYDFVNLDMHPNDDNAHGTHVAGTIAQSTNNNLGVSGVAFNAKIMPVKVLDGSGSGLTSWVADGIKFAADNGAKVISLSLGSTSASSTLESALAYAYNKGVTIVAAAGNGGAGGLPNYPAAYNNYVIAVAATRYDETRSPYSTTGSYVDVAAPGGDTSIDQNGDGYGDGVLQQTFDPNTRNTNAFAYYFFQGTSMATPHVSGLAAMLIAKGLTTPAQVREAIEKTAEDKGAAGWDSSYGWGIINAKAALQYNSVCTDNDLDTYCAETIDCNDNNAAIHPGAAETLCNNIDDDCDGLKDENYASFGCGTGACQQQSVCSNGTETCAPLSPSSETCNGIDDDCNGLVDDNLVAPLCDNQNGVCFGSTKTCGGLSGWLACSSSNYGPNYQFNETSCNDFLDNDCDGLADLNDFNCLTCIDNDNDGYGTNCQAGNDCNDNNAAVNPGASDANCDGVDNKCDNSIDEGYVATSTNCGVGACASTGQLLCQSGTLVNTCTPGTPTTDVCNGIDDDCDGSIDEGNVCLTKCWSGSNLYLVRGASQFKKFCLCAQGTYAYRSYSTVGGTRTAFKYIDANNNNNWATTSQSQSSPAYRVRCNNGVLYYTNVDYYR